MAPSKSLGSQGLEVSAQGLGCMGMSFAFGPPKPELDMINLLHFAVNELGLTFLDTADAYGPFLNERLLGKALKGVIREKVQIATKFGIHVENGRRSYRGNPEYVRACCEASLRRLDIDCIDLYYVHRVDARVPIEITMRELKQLVQEGKIKYVGLSEASPSTIRRAHAVHPISAVQLEWSLWSRNAEKEVIPTCRELGIGIVPFSPLGRGFFSKGEKILEGLLETDMRKKEQPRFASENLKHNVELYMKLNELASRKRCRPGQLALAWLYHQGDDVVPIPGTTRLENLKENVGALDVKLSKRELKELEAVFHENCAAGTRYGDMSSSTIDTETLPVSEWQGSTA
ncbi:hypothetical protein GOP47_0008211 [Adiantum capillus-veneris]|uniref:NADP-dependent oxidoreductase domain-containing protein n=1 Tax=Adiantum capillus-veneris TaxID=13818 RepID=A0A9D4UYD3_ADICA|nr:hypothetical protein GOP47_0008211 [Adiantum capillus-veneris]